MAIRHWIADWRQAYGFGAEMGDAEVIAWAAELTCPHDPVERQDVITVCLMRLEMPSWAEEILDTISEGIEWIEKAGDASSVTEAYTRAGEAERALDRTVSLVLRHRDEFAPLPLVQCQLMESMMVFFTEGLNSTRERIRRGWVRASRGSVLH